MVDQLEVELLDLKLDSKRFEKPIEKSKIPPGRFLSYTCGILSSGKNSLTYDPEIHGNIEDSPLFHPSKIYLEDGYKDVVIPFPDSYQVEEVSEKAREMMKAEFRERMAEMREENGNVAPSRPQLEFMIQKLAEKYDVLSGKWMIFNLTWERLEEIWQTLFRAFYSGEISSEAGIVEMKVFARDDSDDNPFNLHDPPIGQKLNIKTSNYCNTKEINKILTILRNYGVTEMMKYKPDIYTKLDILNGNEFNVCPVIRASKTKGKWSFAIN